MERRFYDGNFKEFVFEKARMYSPLTEADKNSREDFVQLIVDMGEKDFSRMKDLICLHTYRKLIGEFESLAQEKRAFIESFIWNTDDGCYKDIYYFVKKLRLSKETSRCESCVGDFVRSPDFE